jgi:hypothetical protein
MGQFKPMVKMETTEPSVLLKLKKGGHVNMKKGGKAEHGHKPMGKMDGGVMGALDRAPVVGGPSMNVSPLAKAIAAKKRAAATNKPLISAPTKPAIPSRTSTSMATPAMKQGGKMMKEGDKADMAQDKAMIKKAMKQHDAQEHKGGKGTDLKLKKGGKAAYATGGVVYGQAGFKTGGVAKANAGGFKKGGAAKKHFATGGAVEMEQGKKKPSSPVRIDRLSGTF